jgi:PAS domain S-box-containing protein
MSSSYDNKDNCSDDFPDHLEGGRSELISLRSQVASLEKELDRVRIQHQIELDEVRDNKRQQAISHLQTTENQYRGIFESVSNGIAIYQVIGDGEDFIFKDINPAGERIGCICKQDLLGRSISEIFPKADESGVVGALREVWHSGKSNYLPTREYDDGRLRVWSEVHTFKLTANEIVQVYHDITKLMEAGQALEKSENTYRTLVECAVEEIGALDVNGTILFANHRLCENLKMPSEALVGKTLWDLFPRSIAEHKARLVSQVVDSGEGQTVVLPSEYHGKPRWYDVTIVPLHQEHGQVISVMFIARNVTEIKGLQEQLEIYREQMVKAERLASAGLMSAMVAHELAQPATVIRLTIQNALAELQQYKKEVWYADLQESLQEISRLSELIKRFRSIAQTRFHKNYESLCVKTILEKTIRLMESLCRRRQIEIKLNNADKLIPIIADAADMEQLCFILIENSLHAANSQGANTLDIHCDTVGDHIELQFSDDCGGIDPEHIDHILEPFYTTKAPAEGTGLGLCIVERIVNSVNGRLDINNRPGDGVTFSISLPSNPE